MTVREAFFRSLLVGKDGVCWGSGPRCAESLWFPLSKWANVQADTVINRGRVHIFLSQFEAGCRPTRYSIN
jgi:hypothetical protein